MQYQYHVQVGISIVRPLSVTACQTKINQLRAICFLNLFLGILYLFYRICYLVIGKRRRLLPKRTNGVQNVYVKQVKWCGTSILGKRSIDLHNYGMETNFISIMKIYCLGVGCANGIKS